MFPGGNTKISNVLKISPRFLAVPLGLRYQSVIGSSGTFSVFFFFSSKRNGSGWAQKVIDESLPATAPSAHSGFSQDRPCLHVIIIILKSVYNNIKICLRFFHGEPMAQWDNRALLPRG